MSSPGFGVRANRLRLPKALLLLLAIYSVASAAHFAHNAQYLAFYPNMPAWLTGEKVLLAWLAVSSVGALGVGLAAAGFRVAAALALALYGAFGLDGLGHYALALCAQHTLAMNLSIWAEAVAGVALAAVSLQALAAPPGRGRRDARG